MRPTRPGAILFAIVLAGLGLRLYGLSGQSLWIDEVLSIAQARRILEDGLQGTLNGHGPLFFAVLAAVVPHSTAEFAVRLPSLLSGIALIGACYFIGREVAGPRAGLAAAGLAALSPFAVWYSQESRYVALFMLLAAISTLAAHRFLRDGSWRALMVYVPVTVLMLLTFVAGAFLVAGQTLAFMLIGSRFSVRLPRWLIGQAVVLVLFLGWLLPAYGAPRPGGGPPRSFSIAAISAGYARPASVVQIGYGLYSFAVGYSLGPSVRELHEDPSLRAVARHAPIVAAAALVFGALGAAGFATILARSRRDALFVACGLGAPVLGAYLVANVSGVVFNVRYTAAAFPLFVALVGAGAAAWLKRPRLGAPLCAGAFALFVVSLLNYFGDPAYARDDNRGAARILAALRRDDQPLFVGAETRALRFYYPGAAAPWRRIRLVHAASAADGDAAVPVRDRIWVAATRTWENPDYERFVATLQACFPTVARFDLPGVRVMALAVEPSHGACRLLRADPRARPEGSAAEALASGPPPS